MPSKYRLVKRASPGSKQFCYGLRPVTVVPESQSIKEGPTVWCQKTKLKKFTYKNHFLLGF
jgi:hypothetical protein